MTRDRNEGWNSFKGGEKPPVIKDVRSHPAILFSRKQATVWASSLLPLTTLLSGNVSVSKNDISRTPNPKQKEGDSVPAQKSPKQFNAQTTEPPKQQSKQSPIVLHRCRLAYAWVRLPAVTTEFSFTLIINHVSTASPRTSPTNVYALSDHITSSAKAAFLASIPRRGNFASRIVPIGVVIVLRTFLLSLSLRIAVKTCGDVPVVLSIGRMQMNSTGFHYIRDILSLLCRTDAPVCHPSFNDSRIDGDAFLKSLETKPGCRPAKGNPCSGNMPAPKVLKWNKKIVAKKEIS
ncbi:hypothetical protein AAG570_008660 [Ranatra chinensis]|uniref:Uncharacterized protein n=1 Tax=Ranatra chinensis TaxID=642074 RepID=A0ABD0Z288_9HEMI